MKKLIMILAAILFSFSLVAAPRLQSKKLVKADTDAAVSILYAEEDEPGIIGIIWQADSTLSKAYDIQLGLLDTATYSYSLISDLASYSRAFAIDGYEGYFSISSDLVLEYGDNYSTIGNYGATEAQIAKWQAAWEASVNVSDFTLKAGTYVIFVEGIDLSFNTTEEYDYAIVEIVEDVTTDVINISTSKKSIKFINPKGQLMIYSNGHLYDQLGHKID